ncbi:Aldehyde dehydrogenase domain protein, partial [mine drainage metagenome]
MSETGAQSFLLDNRPVAADGRSTFTVTDPADGTTVAQVVRATSDDARAALESSARTQPAWEAIGATARAKVLREAAGRLRARAEELALDHDP